MTLKALFAVVEGSLACLTLLKHCFYLPRGNLEFLQSEKRFFLGIDGSLVLEDIFLNFPLKDNQRLLRLNFTAICLRCIWRIISNRNISFFRRGANNASGNSRYNSNMNNKAYYFIFSRIFWELWLMWFKIKDLLLLSTELSLLLSRSVLLSFSFGVSPATVGVSTTINSSIIFWKYSRHTEIIRLWLPGFWNK